MTKSTKSWSRLIFKSVLLTTFIIFVKFFPFVIWRDGKVVKVPADQIEVREPEAEYENSKEKGKSLSLLTLNEPGYFGYFHQGVAMLSSVLNSERAIEVNIAIMRAFVQLRKMIASNNKLAQKLAELEQHLESYDEQIQAIFEAIRQLMIPPEKPRKKIGFVVKEKKAAYGKRTKGSRRKK